MLRYPRIEVIKRTSYIPTYQEVYEVQTMRPNHPMQSRCGMNKAQANVHARRELALLKKEGYGKAVYNSMMIDLKSFIRLTKPSMRGCVKIGTPFFAQSPDFLKPGLCYFPKFL